MSKYVLKHDDNIYVTELGEKHLEVNCGILRALRFKTKKQIKDEFKLWSLDFYNLEICLYADEFKKAQLGLQYD